MALNRRWLPSFRKDRNPETFATWLEQARNRDNDAWEELYARSFPQVYRYVHAKVGATMAVEDITEEVFLAAVRSIESLRARDEAGFFAWLFQIARFKIADYLRQQYRRPVTYLDEDAPIPDDGPAPEETALRHGTTEKLRAALQSLSGEQQEVIMLKYVLGYDNDRAGALLGKSPGAINQLQHRALRALRRNVDLQGD